MKILVIEDNPKMAQGIRKGLAGQSFVVQTCLTGYEGEEEAARNEYDAIVLDRMLPDRDGLEVCKNLRARKVRTPILMLTALSATDDKVSGLDAGADDYLGKPFEFDEMVARVRALLRRGQASESRVLKYEDLQLDLDKRSATRAGEKITLSGKQFALLQYLMRNPDRVLTRQAIYERVWDMNYEPSSNVIDVVVAALRRKADHGFTPQLIHTVIGAGYRFGVMDEADGGGKRREEAGRSEKEEGEKPAAWDGKGEAPAARIETTKNGTGEGLSKGTVNGTSEGVQGAERRAWSTVRE